MTRGRPEHDALFAYGTLSLPEVLEALIGTRPPCRPAELEGHACYRVRGAVYPAAVAQAGASTRGVVYEGIRPSEWTLLDRFEGALYECRLCRVRPLEGAPRDAFVYLLAAGREGAVAREPWSREEFARRHLHRYLEACRAFREPYASR